jgi:hypothetical protein
MKTEKSMGKFMVLLSLLFVFSMSPAQDGENLITKSKTITKVFDKESVRDLFVTNSTGDINISRGLSKQLEIVIKIEVTGWQDEDVEIFLEKLVPDISLEGNEEQGFQVLSLFNFKMNKKCACPGEKKVYNPWFGKKAEVKSYRVDYEIKIPETLNSIQLLNAYGNISLPSYTGKLIINLRNGNLKTGNLDLASCECPGITVRYGKVNMGKVNNGILKFNSCEHVKIEALQNSELNSSFSNVRLGYASGVDLQSKSDDVVIQRIDSLFGRGQFTTLSVEELGSYLKFDNRSGEISVKKIESDFSSIVLNGTFNNYHLNVSELSYLFSASLASTELSCPEAVCSKSFREKARNSSITFNKKVGLQPGQSQIKLSCTTCTIALIAD